MVIDLSKRSPEILTYIFNYIINYRLWTNLCATCIQLKTMLLNNPSVWDARIVDLSTFVVPRFLWQRFAFLLKNAAAVKLNATQISWTTKWACQRKLSWLPQRGKPKQHFLLKNLWQTYPPRTSCLCMNQLPSPCGLVFEAKLSWLGDLSTVSVGLTTAPNVRALEASLNFMRWRGIRYKILAAHAVCRTYKHIPVDKTYGFWYFGMHNGRGEPLIIRTFKHQQHHGNNTMKATLGFAWVPHQISFWLDERRLKYDLPLPFFSKDAKLYFFVHCTTRSQSQVMIEPLLSDINISANVPQCSICKEHEAENSPDIEMIQCDCTRYYCDNHGGICTTCGFQACGFCIASHICER